MPLPTPVAGLVIRYSYLWRSEYLRGREEGVKDRPCAVILVTIDNNDSQVVTVLPVTHSPPSDPALAIEIPFATKQRLRLDSERSWVVLEEANRFIWPGPDLSPLRPKDVDSVAYGLLPSGLIDEIRHELVALLRQRRTRIVTRTD